MADTVATIHRSGNLASNSLLSTKLFIPQARHLQDVLPRPRLVERLKAGLSRKLTFISAPAGFGKTSLLAECIPQIERRVAWISLDEADNDIARFLTYVITALQMHQADSGQDLLVALQSPHPPAIESLITALVNEIAQSLDACALVLDDYHLIHLQAIHAAVAFLLHNIPPNMHLIITSRADPPLPLARLRARGQLTELRAADLRFTLDEATAFFHQIKNLPIPAEQIKELDTRTEGWGAGLQLAALSLQGLDTAGIAHFIHDFTGNHHYVFDYLAEEVLQHQPEQIQRFLLHSSVLGRLCGSLCDAVLEIENVELRMKNDQTQALDSQFSILNSQFTLEYLDHANLFLVPLDNRRHWYRYHHLFADFLRERLAREIGAAGVNDLYRRASGWFEQHDLPEEAVNYALAGRDWPGAAKIMEQLSTSLLVSSRYVMKWIESLPAEEVDQSPDLCMWYAGWQLTSGEFGRFEKLLDSAERVIRSSGQDSKLAGVYVYHALAGFLRDDAQPTIDNAQRAITYFDDENRFMHAQVLEKLARGHFLKGDLAEAERVWAETSGLAQAADSQRTMLFVRAAQGELQRARGKLRQAAQLDQDLLQKIGARPADIIKIRAQSRLASLYYEWNDLDQAARYAQLALDLAEQTRRDVFARSAYVMLARIAWARGAADQAVQAIERAKELAQRMGGEHPMTEVSANQIWLWLAQAAHSSPFDPAQGNSAGQSRAAAIEWAATQRLDLDGALPYENQPVYLARCRVLIAQNRSDQAMRVLERLLAAAEAAGRVGEVVEMLVLKALAQQAQYQENQAATTLVQALTLAEPEGYIRTFVDEGLPMAQLLLALRQRPSAVGRGYLDTLLAAFPAGDKKIQVSLSPCLLVTPSPRHPVTPALVEPLSKRELEILALMAQGLTNTEIAQHIVISAQTVKVHTRNIYGKLDVNGRKQAVAKAKALGLLA
jgi:LuxR family transcriptional regulator, maltose regulon positive regulatory protein